MIRVEFISSFSEKICVR